MSNNWLYAHNVIARPHADDCRSHAFALAEISSIIRETCIRRRNIPRPPFSACRALFSIVKDTRLSIRHGEGVSVGMALGIGQDRRGVHAPAGIDTGLLPSHDGRSTDIHIQGRSMERNCTRQQGAQFHHFMGCVYLLTSATPNIFWNNLGSMKKRNVVLKIFNLFLRIITSNLILNFQLISDY